MNKERYDVEEVRLVSGHHDEEMQGGLSELQTPPIMDHDKEIGNQSELVNAINGATSLQYPGGTFTPNTPNQVIQSPQEREDGFFTPNNDYNEAAYNKEHQLNETGKFGRQISHQVIQNNHHQSGEIGNSGSKQIDVKSETYATPHLGQETKTDEEITQNKLLNNPFVLDVFSQNQN